MTQHYPEPFYGPGWTAPAPRWETLAVVALVAGLLVLGPVAIVLGLVALARTRRRGTRGRGLAWTAVALGTIGTLAVGAVGTVVVANDRAARPIGVDVTDPRTVHARQLQAGHCVAELPTDGPVGSVQVVPCDLPHEAQVVHTAGLTGEWSGQAETDEAARAICRRAVVLDGAGGFGEDRLGEGLVWVAWAPTSGSWRVGDRTVTCLVHSTGDPLTGRLDPAAPGTDGEPGAPDEGAPPISA